MPRRVFIGLSEVAGYYGGLQRGLNEIGVKTSFIDESDHPFRYGRRRWYARMCRLLDDLELLSGTARPPLRVLVRAAAVAVWLAKLAYRVALFAWAVARHDVFIIGAGRSILPGVDLPILRVLGKKVVVVFTGSDHRPPYLSGRTIREVGVDGFDRVLALSRETRAAVVSAERNGRAIVALGASAQFHSRPFAHFLAIGIPVDLPDVAPTPALRLFTGKGVRVLHCPSDPVNKGSARVRAAIASIRRRGAEIDYVELTGRPHSEILSAIAAADVVVDEVFTDTPMAVLATEAAWLGKPVVVTGYYAAEMERDLPPGLRPPTAFAHPDLLEATIERLVCDESARLELGRRAKAFVESSWPPALIARRILDLADGRGDPGWTYDPARLGYVHGWGIEEELLKNRLRGLVDRHGIETLGLAHAPELERRVVDFIA
jgi:hypothetical protein